MWVLVLQELIIMAEFVPHARPWTPIAHLVIAPVLALFVRTVFLLLAEVV